MPLPMPPPLSPSRGMRSSSVSSIASHPGNNPSSSSSAGSTRRTVHLGSLAAGLPPPPPVMTATHHHQSSSASSSPGYPSAYSQSIAKSMTIEEMRQLHQHALREAEAKRTELRLVLASRYRELVGSSDEVIRMKERAQELHDLVHALPLLLEKLVWASSGHPGPIQEKNQDQPEGKTAEELEELDREARKIRLRTSLSQLPRLIHRSLDHNQVHVASIKLIELFTLIASQTDAYPMAKTLARGGAEAASSSSQLVVPELDATLEAQMRMVFLQFQTLPRKICRMASRDLHMAASFGARIQDPARGSLVSAAALASLDLLTMDRPTDRATYLLDLYFEAKAQLLKKLLNQLKTSKEEDGKSTEQVTHSAEQILSSMVLLLQYDVIMHPYQIFIARQLPQGNDHGSESILSPLPLFDPTIVKAKCSKILSVHLPLIRAKVKSVLIDIAGTTASALGQIRQSLYDKTDGVASMAKLNDHGVGTWEMAVNAMVDLRVLQTSSSDAASRGANAPEQTRFSLWSALFSNTFSSLVHSLLTTSFQSVHARVVSTLRTSLAHAPPLAAMMPHEAHRNTLRVATDLNEALLKVSDDAHELLVHAEEREESERRLRQSLYVQTCEIMGRLVSELRRMVAVSASAAPSEATTELIVGRLCYLLKFRLTSLPTLLQSDASPASGHQRGGMISFVDLQSAFDLADDNNDGLISLEEAMEAAESAFSGTSFRGAEIVRDTLLLTSGKKDAKKNTSETNMNVSLNELALLTARGLRHEPSGRYSALGTVQRALDDIVSSCFQFWASVVLKSSEIAFEKRTHDFIHSALNSTEAEWRRLFSGSDPSSTERMPNPSPHVVGFMLDVASALNRSTCPSDSRSPVPSVEYASTLGVTSAYTSIPTMMDMFRWTLLKHNFSILTTGLRKIFESIGDGRAQVAYSAVVQFYVDGSFVRSCYLVLNRTGFGFDHDSEPPSVSASKLSLQKVLQRADEWHVKVQGYSIERDLVDGSQGRLHRLVGISDLYFSSLFGDLEQTALSPAGEMMGLSLGASETNFHTPLPSARRFTLLPVQADRTLSEVQLRGKLEKEKEEVANRPETANTSVMSSGLGFLSSILRKSD